MLVVSESACVNEERPDTHMSCDFKPCKPEWYLNEWSQCSVTCGSGFKSRDIRCLDNAMQTSSGCDPTEKPADREQCTQRRCPLSDESVPAERINNRVTNSPPQAPQNFPPQAPPHRPAEKTPTLGPIVTGCEDKFTQCIMVSRANLCQYKYYQKICCGTCEQLKRNS